MITIKWIVSIHSEQKANLNHMRLCQRIMTVVTKMPEACKKILKITQTHKSVETPFVILADNESLLWKIQACCVNDPTK